MMNWVAMLRRICCLTGLAALLFAGETWAQSDAASDPNDTKPQVLVVVPDPNSETAKSLAMVMNEDFHLRATLKRQSDYQSYLDAWVYDGFVYLGEDYYARPPTAFLSDMAETKKPLLWINYHAWDFPQKMADRTGLTVLDRHNSGYNTLKLRGLASLQGADTTIATAVNPARVLYWVFNSDLTAAIPGAIVSGNVVYVGYGPIVDPEHPSWPAFLTAARTAMSGLPRNRIPQLDPQERLAAAKSDTFRSGIHLPFVFNADETTVPYDSDGIHSRLVGIKKAGAEWVTVSWTFFQDGIVDSEPAADDIGTATLSALRNVVEDAHALGLFVRLSVIVNLDEKTRKPNEWRGFIRPRNLETWWTVYRKIVLNAARFAKGTGIESLNVGAELSQMQDYEAEWRDLIADVRDEAGYNGLVGYQVNFDAFENMTWADALDFLSVAAYWPLAEARDPSLESLRDAWVDVGRFLSDWQAANPGISLEFGEIGYTSQPYAAVFPFSWKPNRAAKLSLSEQMNAYLALEEFLISREDMAGVGVFASTLYDHIPDDIGYSPFGKPAEKVVRRLMDLRE